MFRNHLLLKFLFSLINQRIVHFSFFLSREIILLIEFRYLKKNNRKMCIYILALVVIIITLMRISNPLGKTWPGGVNVSSVKSTDVTCKTHSGWLAAQFPWLVNLTSLACDMGSWLRCRVSALQSLVAGSISSDGNHGVDLWWDLVRSKQLSSVSVCRA